MDRIEPIEGGIQVTTKDHRSYKGDILIGADGIHSSVGQEMRRIADATAPGFLEPGEEDKVPCFLSVQLWNRPTCGQLAGRWAMLHSRP